MPDSARRPVGGEWLLDVMQRSGLRGRGGAWFPTHRKWRAVRRTRRTSAVPPVMVVNASEGEPLSAKDRCWSSTGRISSSTAR